MSTPIRPLQSEPVEGLLAEPGEAAPDPTGSMPERAPAVQPVPAIQPMPAVQPAFADQPDPTERVRIIEFRWQGPAGIQPVLYLERTRLH